MHNYLNHAVRSGMALAVCGGMMIGCEQLPGSDETQGAVIGGTAGAGTGALVAGEDNRLIGALIGGALGAGGGYLIGANKDKILGDDDDDAVDASNRAQRDPATAAEVAQADTADINDDGFVTMDEVIAMEQAGLTDNEIRYRLRATDQIFELTEQQENRLVNAGVSRALVNDMESINQNVRQDILRERDSAVISQDM